MKKPITVAFLALIILISSFSQQISFAQEKMSTIDKANELNSLGILAKSNTGYNLENELTRIEGAVMLIRLLNKESEASTLAISHPFTDVPNWATNCINYLYQNKLTGGITPTLYGTNNKMPAKQYITFILRALKHSNFSYDQSLDKAKEIGLIDDILYKDLNNKNSFFRSDMVEVTYNALNLKINNSNDTLLDRLSKVANLSQDIDSSFDGLIKFDLCEEDKKHIITINREKLKDSMKNFTSYLITYNYNNDDLKQEQIYGKIKADLIHDGSIPYTNELESRTFRIQDNTIAILSLYDSEDNMLGWCQYWEPKEGIISPTFRSGFTTFNVEEFEKIMQDRVDKLTDITDAIYGIKNYYKGKWDRSDYFLNNEKFPIPLEDIKYYGVCGIENGKEGFIEAKSMIYDYPNGYPYLDEDFHIFRNNVFGSYNYGNTYIFLYDLNKIPIAYLKVVESIFIKNHPNLAEVKVSFSFTKDITRDELIESIQPIRLIDGVKDPLFKTFGVNMSIEKNSAVFTYSPLLKENDNITYDAVSTDDRIKINYVRVNKYK